MSNLTPASIFFLFLCGHALADFAFQTEWVATNKNRNVRKSLPPDQQKTMQIIWPHLLTAHALQHGLMVYLVSQRLSLGIGETVVHWISDFGKCEKWYGFHTDQVIHIGSKVVWVVLIAMDLV